MKFKKNHNYVPLFRGGNKEDHSYFEHEADALFHADKTIQGLYKEKSPDNLHKILKKHEEKYSE